MSVFALWPVRFWKYVFVLIKYVVFYTRVICYDYLALLPLVIGRSQKKNSGMSSFNVLWKIQNMPSYLYLWIRLNTLMYVDNIFRRKYSHICLITNTLSYTFVCWVRINTKICACLLHDHTLNSLEVGMCITNLMIRSVNQDYGIIPSPSYRH